MERLTRLRLKTPDAKRNFSKICFSTDFFISSLYILHFVRLLRLLEINNKNWNEENCLRHLVSVRVCLW